jgi:hypothetical protein
MTSRTRLQTRRSSHCWTSVPIVRYGMARGVDRRGRRPSSVSWRRSRSKKTGSADSSIGYSTSPGQVLRGVPNTALDRRLMRTVVLDLDPVGGARRGSRSNAKPGPASGMPSTNDAAPNHPIVEASFDRTATARFSAGHSAAARSLSERRTWCGSCGRLRVPTLGKSAIGLTDVVQSVGRRLTRGVDTVVGVDVRCG